MTNLITRARKEWCEQTGADPRDGKRQYYQDGVCYEACPPEVVAALLDVLAWAKTHACAPHANRDCACCTALGRLDDALEGV